MIGARTVGASTRALDLSLAFAAGREQFGRPIVAFQAIEFMLADMAAELMAAKSLLYRELRVDRIWEGTSEIQRVVIGNELRKRGHGVYSGWV